MKEIKCVFSFWPLLKNFICNIQRKITHDSLFMVQQKRRLLRNPYKNSDSIIDRFFNILFQFSVLNFSFKVKYIWTFIYNSIGDTSIVNGFEYSEKRYVTLLMIRKLPLFLL